MPRLNIVRPLYAITLGSLTGLIALCVAWELWLAPLRPGGSWMVLKVLPLLAPLFGILRGRIHTYQWATMLMLAYFIEGSTRAYADSGLSAALAGVEIVLALVFIAAAGAYVRAAAPPRPAAARSASRPR